METAIRQGAMLEYIEEINQRFKREDKGELDICCF
jgi:hypothetical protein